MDTKTAYPKFVKTQSRVCFGVEWFDSEAKADLAGKMVRERGDRYNGGFMDGMSCGRDPGLDHDDPELGRLYAVTRQ